METKRRCPKWVRVTAITLCVVLIVSFLPSVIAFTAKTVAKNMHASRFAGGYEISDYIGEEKIMKVDLPDQDLHIGIRPEGFIVNPKGKLTLDLSNIEVMGRDSSLVCNHEFAESEIIRAIIDADTPVNPVDGKVKVNVKPNKIFLFNYETEERIRLEGEAE